MKVAVVTGAASGLGYACAQHLATEGWRLGLVDLPGEKLERAAKDIPNAAAFACDISDEGQVEAAIAGAAALGQLAGVVNCAGIAIDKTVRDTTSAELRRILEVNVIGTFQVARAAVPYLEASRGGSIVNISSVSGLRGNVGRTAYGTSKGAVQSMTLMMAIDLADAGIRVNAIAPGPIESPLAANMVGSATRDDWIRQLPMHRFGQPADIAAGVAFLLDPAKSGFITGQIIAIDGGFTAGGLVRKPR